MIMTKRHREILTILANTDGGRVTVNQFAERLNVSQATIRQDLTYLEKGGLLRRIHGGALLDETDDIAHRMGINYEGKLKIAKSALQFVDDGETILIESGSINTLFALEIVRSKKNVTIITSNAFIARQIGKLAENRVILLGGIYQPESESVVGNLVKECLKVLNFSKAFIGVDGYTKETGFTGRDMMRGDISSTIAKHSPQTFILTDSSKFGKIYLSRYLNLDQIDYVLTDEKIPKEYSNHLTQNGVTVIIT
jgi:DeoR/GlpR family transcriptional regulator of sugar metabolism